MIKDELTNTENKKGSEQTDILYSGNSISEKHNSKIRYGKSPKVEDDGNNEKYIKEMYGYADRNDFRSNIIFWGSGIGIVFVIIFFLILSNPFSKIKTNVVINKVATKNVVNSSYISNDTSKLVETPEKIYEYLNVETNRASVLKKAVNLNKGSQKGVTIYLLSEILRLNSIYIPARTSNVEQLMKSLTSMQWKKNNDFNQLKRGDICFTTDVPKKVGVPSHTYIFMGWVEDGKTDYAYVCDGQIEQYGNILHKRNISIPTTKNDKFNFFLRK